MKLKRGSFFSNILSCVCCGFGIGASSAGGNLALPARSPFSIPADNCQRLIEKGHTANQQNSYSCPTKNHGGILMWPFAGMSLSAATLIGSIANWALLICLLGGVFATFVIVQTTDVKEEHWAEDRTRSNEHIAELNNQTALLQADNLALQTVLLPRHVGLIGIDESPRALTWFAGFQQWAGTKILIQVAPGDPEAQNLANEIAIVLSKFGWVPELIDEKRSGVSLNLSEGLTVISPSSYKAWDPKNEAQQVFGVLRDAAIALARALTNVGLGVGSYPVSGANGLGMVVDFPPESEGEAHNPFRNFSPRLDGVYLQVGSRPVGSTMAWIRNGRPDALGNKAAPAPPASEHK